ncbi:MAG: hypothetical protein HY043_11570 [Verrucomicrobia bacterium]|nr:hypothetical protein [Verrucomicrobiota bacterium]
MKFFCFLITWTAGWLAFTAPLVAAERAPETFLFVVDTSFSMASQKQLLQAAVRESIASGLGGQMKPGDKLNIWTFNREANTRQFTPIEWRPESRAEVAAAAFEFLARQNFSKISRLDLAMVEIVNSLEDRAPLTVVLCSDGFEYVWGTTFDAQINRVYRENSARVRREGKSFVTMLRALDGLFVSSRVTILGDPLKLPELPTASPIAQTIRPPAPTPSVSPPVVPPVKPIPAPPVAKAPPATAITNVEAKVTPPIPADTKPVTTPPVASANVNERIAAPQPPALDLKPGAKLEAAAEVKKDPLAQLASVSIESKGEKARPTPLPAEIPKTPAIAVATPPNPTPVEKPAAASPEAKSTAAGTPVNDPPVAPKISLSPVVAAVRTPAPAAAEPATASQKDSLEPAAALVAPKPTNSAASAENIPAALAEAAMLPPPVGTVNWWGYILLGGALLLAASWLAYFFWTRGAAEPKSSIITRSLDQKRR